MNRAIGNVLKGRDKGHQPRRDALSTVREFCRSGNYTRARKACSTFLKQHPRDPQALHLMGNLLAASNNRLESIRFHQQALVIRPDEPVYHYNLANVFNALNNRDQALAHYHKTLELNPAFAAAWNSLGLIELQTGDEKAAIHSFKNSIRINDNQSTIHSSLGGIYLNLRQDKLAATHTIRALEIDPRNCAAWNNLGTIHQHEYKAIEAIECYHNALEICPEQPDATLNMGIALYLKGDHREAIPFFERFVGWHPKHVQAHAYLAELHESLHHLAEAGRFVAATLELDPLHPGALRIQATILRRQGCPAKGVGVLSRAVIPADPVVAQGIHFELGKSYDKLRDSKRAFEHFCEGNRYLALTGNAHQADKQVYLAMLDDLHEQATSDWIGNWRRQPTEGENSAPVFLIGCPRSGTTLLDQILDSHPTIQVVEEQPMLDVLKSTLSSLPEGYPGALAILEESDILQLRKAYFTLLNEFQPLEPGMILIDKYPLNLVHAGLIKRIFPDSKFILAMRHPCDVVLSCFMQPFKPNDAMANYYNLADGAHLYDRVMSLWMKYTDLFGLDYHTVKYERLVDEFEPVVKALFGYLEVDWCDRVLNYAEHARTRVRINTPSYNQVTQPIYRDAKYRWLRYEQYLEDVMDKLDPYIRSFEYE